ncbi:MAG: hypothetical protein AB7O78_15805 [Thermoleophilia bacterium]
MSRLRILIAATAVAAACASPAAAIQVTALPVAGYGQKTPIGIAAGPDGRVGFVV